MWRLNPDTNRLHCLKVWPSQGERSEFERSCYEIQFEKGIGLPGESGRREAGLDSRCHEGR